MALLIDSDLIAVRDLLCYENDLLETADRERVEVETKIALGVNEVRTETETEVDKILRSGAGNPGAIASIGNVVATPGLLRWAQFRCLALFYFQCYGNQLNERFRAKFEHYRKEGETARREFLQRGIGVADVPLPKPGTALIAAQAGSLPAGAYTVAATWVNSRGNESGMGAAASLLLETAGAIDITPPAAPAGASEWNVYVGQTAESMYRQNEAPIVLGMAWMQSEWPLRTIPFSGGQQPDRYLQPQRIFQRG